MDEYSRLLTLQQTIEKESADKIEFFGLSVDETIKKCLLNGMSKRADKLKSDFKVPDKRYEMNPCPPPGLAPTRSRSHTLSLAMVVVSQILVLKATRADGHAGLRGPRGIFAVEAESDWVRAVREASRREGPREGSGQLRAALRCPQARRSLRRMRRVGYGWQGVQGAQRSCPARVRVFLWSALSVRGKLKLANCGGTGSCVRRVRTL